MVDQVRYTETGVGQIGQTLARLFAPQPGSEKSRTQTANTSFIMIAASPADLETIDKLIDTFAPVHPSRFFVLHMDGALGGVKAEVAVRKHLISGRHEVGCEVIRIGAPPAMWSLVPNTVRANLATGMSAELFIHSAAVNVDAVRSIATFVDQVIFDSSEFEGNFEAFEILGGLNAQLVDLQWVRMGAWRDQMKGVFDRPAFQALLGSLETVQIAATSRKAGAMAASALLMGGWIAHALKLEPTAFGSSGFECRRENGSKVELRLECDRSTTDSRLTHIEMIFGPQAGGVRPRVILKRSTLLETVVETDQIYKTSRPFDDESQAGLIRRYFLIGESITNYPRALELAQVLDRLQQSFRGV